MKFFIIFYILIKFLHIYIFLIQFVLLFENYTLNYNKFLLFIYFLKTNFFSSINHINDFKLLFIYFVN